MIRSILAGALLIGLCQSAGAQTLFTYGSDTVTAPEFLTAYRKNNGAGKGNSSLNDYLDLYITSRLKVREARRLGYDTLPQMVTDLQNLREQLLPTYLNDLAGVDGLVKEAFQRSQKNIRVCHLFIAAKEGSDTSMAWSKVMLAMADLKAGKSFATVAKTYSEDPSVKTNAGDLGWVAVFSLPYELENLAWQTTANGPALVYRSRAGYHIFKNMGERPDPGFFKGSQILLAFPPGSSDPEKAALKKRADSIYQRLLKGDEFGRLAVKFSNDVVSANSNGELPDISAGQYEPLFEEKIFGLAKDGAITPPFQTAHGWHIVKRTARKPRATVDSASVLQSLRELVESSDRMGVVRNELARNVRKQTGFTVSAFSKNDLWAYSDSVMEYKKTGQPIAIDPSTVLYTVSVFNGRVSDWIQYASSNRFKSDGSGAKSWDALWDEFTDAAALDYYKGHLEEYNPGFRAQMEEFRDGNLFFEIMQREVWGPAQNDTAALETYYAAHKDRYVWKQSADAVLFYAPDAATAKSAQALVAKKPMAWRTNITNYDDRIAIDSNRFELDQIPNPTKLPLKPGTVTAPQSNPADGSTSFALVLRMRPEPGPRSFSEARGLVIADYQKQLEERWINTLRAKYPVTINQPVLLELLKGK
jgi:peptidyl-prolyl cis-trans isomerase SurA